MILDGIAIKSILQISLDTTEKFEFCTFSGYILAILEGILLRLKLINKIIYTLW